MKRCLTLAVLALACFVGVSKPCLAQESEHVVMHFASETKTLDEVVTAAKDGPIIDVEGTRYTVLGRATGLVRRLADDTRSALSLWSGASGEGHTLDYSREEIEIVHGETTLWMPVARLVKKGLLDEAAAGRAAYLHLRVLGSRDGRPVLYIESVRSFAPDDKTP